MVIEIPILISIVSLFISAVVGFSTLRRNHSTDDREMASEMTTLIVKLENISNGVNEIKSDMRNMRTDIQDLRERIIRVEQSTDSAHHRIDLIENGGNRD